VSRDRRFPRHSPCLLAQLPVGAVARIIRTEGARYACVLGYGLCPGVSICMLQKRPCCVIRSGETEIALEAEVAQDIWVEQSD